MKSHAFLAFLGGAIVGGVAALLLAPKSGEETREQIKKRINEEKKRFKENLESLKDTYETVEEGVMDSIKDAMKPQTKRTRAKTVKAKK